MLTAAEEGGCIGSAQLAKTQLLGKAGAMIVGEPTSNYPLVGHKGSLKFHAGSAACRRTARCPSSA